MILLKHLFAGFWGDIIASRLEFQKTTKEKSY